MKQLYALLTNNCNLSCPHCDIRSTDDNFNEEKFISQLKKFDGLITLFGGEPTLYRNRLMKILSLNKAASISTNLTTELDREIIEYFKRLSICTSWNLNRFSIEEYTKWLNNLKILNNNDIKCTVLITLTPDLIKTDINSFMKMIKYWDEEFPAIESIMFEQLIDPSVSYEFYKNVDNWLCDIHNQWKNITIKNIIDDRVKDWYCDCSQTFSLHPNGEITNGCPHLANVTIAKECLTCEKSNICKPCRLQQFCTYPKKLAQLIKEECSNEN